MMDAFMGTIMAVGFNYAPRGWMFCNGQVISIAQNSAMFALLGITYGGDGQSTFGLPDLRGRVAVGSQAQGPGLSNVVQGEKAGTNNVTIIANGSVSVTLTLANMPAHSHPATLTLNPFNATTQITVGTGTNGQTNAQANNGGLTNTAAQGQTSATLFLPPNAAPANPVNLGGVSTTVTGGGTVTTNNVGSGTPVVAPVMTTATTSIMQPYLGLNYIICMEGIFPSRN
ncbi:phage tail protein [Undibacterium fentianense]|uniref:Tail fiber protein n=1 Tax=Undibacterium fentianense TaxID=2828728 RepID=A0A941E4Z6_9BURK|nr:tail fiber protein [Undibacterium fentianense]MBR7800714.1 tail fiber protein [Undibacterium fentianense]